MRFQREIIIYASNKVKRMSKRFVVIDKKSSEIVSEHFADAKGRNPQFGDDKEWVELEVPMDAVVAYLRVVCYKDKYSLAEDLQKKKAYLDQKLQEKLDSVRNERNFLLKESDWTLGPDSPLTDVQKQAWKKYRQQLRDLPQKITSYNQNILWPSPPK